MISRIAPKGQTLSEDAVRELLAQACPAKEYTGKKILLIVPDGTRTAPIGLIFRLLHEQIAEAAAAFDILIALGTHQPMSEAEICRRLEISEANRQQQYGRVRFFNHAWDDPAALTAV